jgi:hypothetical protein
MEVWMDYQVDLDPTHSIIRITVTTETLTLELSENFQQSLSLVASRGGPYATIIDLLAVTSCTIPSDAVWNFAFRDPGVPGGRTQVVVAREPSVFGVARMFQLLRDFFGEQHKVVHSLEEAYEIVGARPEDFTRRLLPRKLAA